MTFGEALDFMLKGEKVKLPGWDGYWEWSEKDTTILIHNFEGRAVDLRTTEKMLSVLIHITQNDWEIATSSNCLVLGGEETFSFSKALEYLLRGFKVRREIWEKDICIEQGNHHEAEFSHPYIQKLCISEQILGHPSRMPWTPTQEELFANDWQIYRDELQFI